MDASPIFQLLLQGFMQFKDAIVKNYFHGDIYAALRKEKKEYWGIFIMTDLK